MLPGVYLRMTLLLETNQRHSRLLFLSCLIIALVLSPVVLRLVEPPADPNVSQWDMRSMWY
jgi:peptidoglycan/LPS O-acetylase OafA/YrhL